MDLLGRYSNHESPLKAIRRALSKCGTGETELLPDREPKQAQRRLSQTEVAALVGHYRAGRSLKDLAQDFQVHRGTVAAHLDRHGVTNRRGGLDPGQIDEAIRLYNDGWSLARIAESFAVYPTSVYYWLRKKGVTLRPRQGWNR